MARTCRGICIQHESPKTANKLRYDLGHKRCTYCALYINTLEVRCPCCKATLRTKPRNKKKNYFNYRNLQKDEQE